MVKAGGDTRVIGLPPGLDHWAVWIEDLANKVGARSLSCGTVRSALLGVRELL